MNVFSVNDMRQHTTDTCSLVATSADECTRAERNLARTDKNATDA